MADSSLFSQRFTRNQSNHPYKVMIMANDGNGKSASTPPIVVTGWLPEEVNLDIGATYDATYGQGLNEKLPGIGALSKAFGVNLATQAMTVQVWQGGTELTFSISIVFQAESSAYNDVMFPIKQLLKLTMPKEPTPGGLLEAPGPHINIAKLKMPVNGKQEVSLPTPQQGATTPADPNNAGGISTISDGVISAAKTLGETAGKVWQGVSGVLSSTTSALGSLAQVPGNMVSSVKGFMSEGAIAGTINGVASFGASTASSLKGGASKALGALSSPLVAAIDGNISLYIGNFIFVPSVVITDVSPAFNVVLGPDQNPIRATVNVSFKMFYIPTQSDIDVMFWNEGKKSPVGSLGKTINV